MRTYLLSFLVLSFGLAACGDDPVSFSQPVAINLKAKSADTINNTVADEKSITTESSNPYGAFIANARDALDGRDPSSITVETLSLFLGASSVGVTTLGEIFNGDIEVVFQMNDTDNSFTAGGGYIDPGTTAGPYDLDASFASGALGEQDWPRMLSGSFKVIIRGPAAPDFTTKGADADLQLTFEFAAFE